MKISTRIVEEEMDPLTGALTFPVYQTSSYLLPMGEKYRYTRESNPTVEELSRKMASIEEAPAATSFSSGMGAITSTFLSLLSPGSNLVIGRDVFGRSYKFSTEFLSRWGVNVSVADPGTDNVLSLIKPDTDMVFVEGISNPGLRVNDIGRIAHAARENGAILVVDSTFTTPVNQRPFGLGADLVVHSASKFLSGHNDVIAGIVAGREDLVRKVDTMRRTLGPSLDPHAAFLVLRGLKTLKIRMKASNESALKIASRLEQHEKISRVYYPGLESDPDHGTAVKTLEGFGGVVSFDISGSEQQALSFMSALKLIKPANTLGGVNSTISHPGTMSHRGLSEEERNSVGIGKTMMRLSVGLEDPDDLMEDIENALDRA